MIKKLLIGASALAFATAAAAQTTPPQFNGNAVNPGNYEIGSQDRRITQAFETELNESSVKTSNNPDSSARKGNIAGTLPTDGVQPSAATVLTAVEGATGYPLNFTDAGNKSVVDQDGSDNTANVNQASGNSGWSAVNQQGDNSNASVTQRDGSNGPRASNNGAYIQQISPTGTAAASGLVASIDQTYAPGFASGDLPNNAAILQGTTGDGNPAESGAATASRASITQAGQRNDATVLQGIRNALRTNNSANVVQIGELNRAVVMQNDNAKAAVVQWGNGDQAYIRQRHGDGGTGTNEVTVLQGAFGIFGNNYAAVSQQGSDQEVGIDQSLAANSEVFASQTSTAQRAVSLTHQLGDGHFAEIFQSSADARSEIYQEGLFGIGNTAYVSQTGGAFDTSNIAQSGNGNLAVVTQ